MANDVVLVSKNDGICTITMNRPPKAMNALNGELIEGLLEAFQQCFDDSVRAVVFTGTGKAFCLGGDIAWASTYGNSPQDFFKDFTVPLARLISDMRQLPKPIIASVNGICAGVGMSFASACDLRICHSEVIFKQAYTGVGISQDGGFSQFIPLIVGLGRASELVFLDEVITADKALSWGLVNKVTAPEALEEETMKMAAKLAKGATKAFASSKALLNRALLPYLEVQLEAERNGVMSTSMTADYQEGVAVFMGQKKKAEFTGK